MDPVARVVDLLGQRRVLPYVLAAHAVSVGLLLVGGPVLDLVAATLVGVTLPQLSALSAACWSALLRGARDEAALPKAFALEALANALSYLAGPALVSTAGAAGRPELGTLLAAVLVVGGGLAFAVQRRTAPPVEGRDEHRTATRALLRPAFARQVAFTLALGVFFGAMQVSVTAYAVGRGTPDSAPCSTRSPTAPACWRVGSTGCEPGAPLRVANGPSSPPGWPPPASR
ncbi:hypothetical protein ACFQ0Q_01230 [Streptomyces aureus]